MTEVIQASRANLQRALRILRTPCRCGSVRVFEADLDAREGRVVCKDDDCGIVALRILVSPGIDMEVARLAGDLERRARDGDEQALEDLRLLAGPLPEELES